MFIENNQERPLQDLSITMKHKAKGASKVVMSAL